MRVDVIERCEFRSSDIDQDDIRGFAYLERADLIVLDQNIFELTPDEIWDTNVLLTMMNGRVTHGDPALGG